MTRVGRWSVSGFVVVGLLVAISLGVWTGFRGQAVAECLEGDPKAFAAALLPSITEFQLVNQAQLNPNSVLAAIEQGQAVMLELGTGKTFEANLHLVDLRSDEFSLKLNNIAQDDMQLARTFQGTLVNQPESLVALYIQPSGMVNGIERPGFVSGYIVENSNDPSSEWTFIEPARPLLKPLLSPHNPDAAFTMADLNGCLSITDNPHIVYEAGDTFSTINLDPTRQAKPSLMQYVAPCQTGTDFPVMFQGQIQNQTNKTWEATVALMVDGQSIMSQAITLEPGVQTTVDFQHTFEAAGQYVAGIELSTPGFIGHTQRPLLVVNSLELSQLMDGNCDGGISFSEMQVAKEYFHNQTALPIGGRFISESAFSDLAQIEQSKETIPAEISLEPLLVNGVADSAYFTLYNDVIQEKTWWEGQEEVLNLVSAFFTHEIAGLNIQLGTLEAWSKGGPGTDIPDLNDDGEPDINVYTMLCQLAQGIPTPVTHTDSDSLHLVHLFSGYDFGPIKEGRAISDSGNICASTCSKVGTEVLGLSEDSGWLRSESSQSCASRPLDEPQQLRPGGHHSVSQQTAEFIQDGDKITNSNYQATLHQRFLLLAHELGHTLGAQHSIDEQSMMYSPLQNTIRFQLDDVARGEIINCLKNC